jgi:hypothetical protein
VAAETGFTIDGEIYEVPSIDSLTMDEAQVLYDYSGLTIEDFSLGLSDDGDVESEELQAKMRNPGFMRALLHVAYQRAHPKQNPARVKALIGSANIIATFEKLAEPEDEGDDALPPASTTEHEQSSERSSVDSNKTSGTDSASSSDGQVVQLPATTDGDLPLSESLRTGSAA